MNRCTVCNHKISKYSELGFCKSCSNKYAHKRGIYKKYGYKTLIIWGKELKNLNKTNQKIKRFIHDSQ